MIPKEVFILPQKKKRYSCTKKILDDKEGDRVILELHTSGRQITGTVGVEREHRGGTKGLFGNSPLKKRALLHKLHSTNFISFYFGYCVAPLHQL
jgi:hypothetical protein